MNHPRPDPRRRMGRAVVGLVLAGAVGGAAVPALAFAAPGTTEPDGGPPVDIEFQIDMILGLVPQEEMAQYWAAQERDRQLAIQACMNESGFEYAPEEYPNADPMATMTPLEYAEQWGFGVWTTMDPDNNPFGSDTEWVWPNEEIVNALSASEQNAWYEANSRCVDEAVVGEDETWRNPMVQESLADFTADVENDPRVQAAVQGWRDCMAEAGHPFASQDEMYTAVYGSGDENSELQQRFFESEAWKPESPDHAEWQALVDEEISIAVADATCTVPLLEAREAVATELRPQLVAVWQTIDWDLPPVTFAGEDDVYVAPGDTLFGDEVGASPSAPGDTAAPIDLSGGSATTTEP